MVDIFKNGSTSLVLAAVVATFMSLYRHRPTPQKRLWMSAWIILALRATIQAFGRAAGIPAHYQAAIVQGALELSGTFFLLSETKLFEVPRFRLPLLLSVGIPATLYGMLRGFDVQQRWIYMLLIAALGCGAVLWIVFVLGKNIGEYTRLALFTIIVLGAWTELKIFLGSMDFGFFAVITYIFAFSSLFFWRNRKRSSPGVLLTCCGFLGWAALFPFFYLIHEPSAVAALVAVANVPKIIVALGMIVTLLEEESMAASAAREDERATRQQLQRFYDVTSRLLSGVEAPGICSYIAQMITETSNFRRAVILLSDEQRHLYVAGGSGVEPQALEKIQEGVSQCKVEAITQMCLPEAKFGTNSFRSTTEKLRPFGAQASNVNYPPNPYWGPDDELVVPLRSPRGVLMGCISLDDPKVVERVNAEELYAVELLAADLAVSIENANLQRQLVISEKLAGIGQLVSGVAHELNNPLTAVLGYAEILADNAQEESVKRDLGVVRREALRMKHIIENLLRFARQAKFDRASQSLAAVLDDVLKLRAYDLRRQEVQLSSNIPAELPGVMVEENLLKQVFLNILNNALDAIAGRPEKKIMVEASAENHRVQLRFTDSGPGFTDLDHVFDPFFTTKSPGKGTGLGLSICYGIIKGHGGEITAFNLPSGGACVLIELPAAGESDTPDKKTESLTVS